MSVDWTIPRTGVYRFYRVDYTTRLEEEELTTILPGGTITRNLNTELKESGTLSCVSPTLLGDDLIRIYYVVEDDEGEEQEIALATMHAAKPSSLYTAAAESASLELFSALLTASQNYFDGTFTVAAGDVAVTEANQLISQLNLPSVLTPGTKTLGVDKHWDAGTSYLTVVNDLLEYANCWSAGIDAWGRITIGVPYQAPQYRGASYTFADGENCTYLPAVSVDSSWFFTPNKCILVSSNPSGTYSGSYTNESAYSPFSTTSRGRTITLYETVTDAANAADLNARAERRLLEATNSTENTVITHAYCPVNIGDVVNFAWSTHDMEYKASVQSQDISLTPAGLTVSTLRRIWT